jgi:hypothetical protein
MISASTIALIVFLY